MTDKPTLESEDYLLIEEAEEHNLKQVSLRIPKNQLVVITGLSGSGKSSLAFDTIYAEGQRRYLESFASYARQFMGTLKRPKVQYISGLSPVIAIEQKTISKNLRSTVGTITEIYDFLRLLFARIGIAYSYKTGLPMQSYSEQEILAVLKQQFATQRMRIYAPLIRGRKGHYQELFISLAQKGYTRVRVDGVLQDVEENMRLSRYKTHNIELLIDTIDYSEVANNRLELAVKHALELGKGTLLLTVQLDDQDENSIIEKIFSKDLLCIDTGLSYEIPSPNSFSFNLPSGYCSQCKGLGMMEVFDMDKILRSELSIDQGALLGVTSKKNPSTYKVIQNLAKQNKISLTSHFSALSKEKQQIILHGSGDNHGILTWLQAAKDKDAGSSLNIWASEFMQEIPCELCQGARLKKESLYFKIADQNIHQLCTISLSELSEFFQNLPSKLNTRELLIARDVITEIQNRLGFLVQVGLGYLSLSLPSRSLSGGESQRVRLSSQIGSGLQGIIYILDEPSIGLHASDNHRLIQALKRLRNLGNTVIVVEHDRDIMLASDYIIDMGPGAGIKGGEIVAMGKPEQFCKIENSTTANFLRASLKPIAKTRRTGNGNYLHLKGASGNNLKNISLTLPLGTFIVVSGLSGAGKSTLINDTLYPALYTAVHRIKKYSMPYESLEGSEFIRQVIQIDQSPIGRITRSNPATYCGFFTEIRNLFASLPEARIRAYSIGRFSFNVKGGRCENCDGLGFKTIEMGFLPAVNILCDHCQGKRYNRDTLDVCYKGKSIGDVLNMEIDEAVEFFKAIPILHRKLKIMQEVGLGYLTLGHNSTLLSGGEAQRIKLCTELSRKHIGGSIYILDEPTTGLHFQDIELLLSALDRLVDKGSTVIIVEHNIDVIKHADYIIDMGPGGGRNGGEITATGSPEQLVANYPENPTAQYLAKELVNI